MIRKFIIIGTIFYLLLPGDIYANSLSVSKEMVKIRNRPDLDATSIVLQAPLYYPLRIREQRDEFFKVEDYKARIGWIHASAVDRTPSIIVSADTANVRSGPGLEHAILFKAREGVAFQVLENKNNWLRIRHESKMTGWIYKPLAWGYD